ncbi:MAG: hypothetical protein OXN90_02275 [Gemmatimonadota bacterium]|nr:hypothetical protein [Gemmatimonadota bacterium]
MGRRRSLERAARRFSGEPSAAPPGPPPEALFLVDVADWALSVAEALPEGSLERDAAVLCAYACLRRSASAARASNKKRLGAS